MPKKTRYFWIRTEGEPRVEEPEGERLHHVGAVDEAAARKAVDEIEEQHGAFYDSEPWKIVDVKPATEAVDPDA